MGKKKRSRERATAETPTRTGPRRVFVPLLAILLVAGALRCWHVDSPIGGFHGFNEAHYTLVAKNFFHGPLLAPTPDGKDLFLETPPLFPWLLHAVYRLTGVSVVAGRLLSVAASLATVVVVFLLGAVLFGAAEGLVAALLLAVAPVAVLTGRNIQTDATLVFFTVLALLFYWRAESGGSRDRRLFGLSLGLALLTKVFAVVAGLGLVVWELVARRNLKWLRDRDRWIAAATAVGGLALYYGYHAIFHLSALEQDWTAGAGLTRSFSQSVAELAGVVPEAFWAFSPAVTLLMLASLLVAWRRPGAATLFVLIQFVSFFLFFFFVHKHSYYLLTALPWGALLAARLVTRIPGRRLKIALVAVTAGSASFVSLIDLTSMKLGFSEFEDLARVAPELPARHRVLVDQAMWDSYSTLVMLSDPRAQVSQIESLPAGANGRLSSSPEDSFLLTFVPPNAAAPPAGWLFQRARYGLTLFGWTLAEAHPNPHFFRQGSYLALRTGGPSDFGLRVLRTYPALALLPIPPGSALYRTEKGIVLAPDSPPNP